MNIQYATTGTGPSEQQQVNTHSSAFTGLRFYFLKDQKNPQALLEICSSLLQPHSISMLC